jgi:hypothetical protein
VSETLIGSRSCAPRVQATLSMTAPWPAKLRGLLDEYTPPAPPPPPPPSRTKWTRLVHPSVPSGHVPARCAPGVLSGLQAALHSSRQIDRAALQDGPNPGLLAARGASPSRWQSAVSTEGSVDMARPFVNGTFASEAKGRGVST